MAEIGLHFSSDPPGRLALVTRLLRSGGSDHAAEIRRLLVRPAELCQALGLTEGYRPVRQAGGGLLIRCPSHGDRSPSCSVRLGPDGTLAVHCFACGFTGDALTLIASVRGLEVHRPDDFRKVLEEGAALAGYDLHAEPDPRAPHAPRPPPAPPPAPTYPPADEVTALWTLAGPLSADAEASASLTGRSLDVGALERLDLARVLPRGASVPSWARCGLPWPASGHRLLVPVYDASAVLRSLRAWRLDGQDPKRVAPTGHSTVGLVLANAAGRQLLATGQADVDLVIVEGEPDFLTWALASEGRAVLGIVAHAWTPTLAARLPDGTRVALRVHRDRAGDKYAAALTTSLAERCELHDFPRPSEGEQSDENELLRAGELPADPFESLVQQGAQRRRPPSKKTARSTPRVQDEAELLPEPDVVSVRPPHVRPVIEITTLLHDNIDAASAALVHAQNLYQRDDALVQVLRDEQNSRDPRAPIAKRLQPATLRKLLARCAQWTKYDGRKKDLVDCLPTDHITQGVFYEGQWPGVRSLTGILETPFLRPDGSVCQQRGYDEATGYLLATSETFPAVPEHPTQDDARVALGLLVDVFADFPFVSEAARYVPVADILTVLARPALENHNIPLSVYDASSPGTGKTLGAEAVCVITMGRVIPKTPYPMDPKELDKFLAAVAREASLVVFLDNATTPVGGGYLDAALTSNGIVKFRILGVSENAESLWIGKVIITGNNVTFKGDTPRRALVCRQETDLERPETREAFRHPDLLGWVREHRGELVAAALTVLRAYHEAGRPAVPGVKPLGSFTDWTKLVVNAIAWAGGANVLDTIASDGRDTEEIAALRELLHGWFDLCAAYGPQGLTASAALNALYPKLNPREPPPPDDGWDTLRGAVETLCHCPSGSKPTASGLTKKLGMYRGRVLSGQRLQERIVHKTAVWWVDRSPSRSVSTPVEKQTQQHPEGELGELRDSFCLTRGKCQGQIQVTV